MDTHPYEKYLWKIGAGFESGIQANCDAVCQREVLFRPRNDRVLHVDTVRTELRSELRGIRQPDSGIGWAVAVAQDRQIGFGRRRCPLLPCDGRSRDWLYCNRGPVKEGVAWGRVERRELFQRGKLG